MDFRIDHDYHIHSYISDCSSDPEQSMDRILKYGMDNGFKHICITDHFWDSAVSGANDWYKPQNYDHIKQCLPLPQDEKTKFHFGCEAEVDMNNRIGISDELIDKFEFIIISTTHMHMTGFTVDEKDSSVERRAFLYLERIRKLMEKDLPFEKIGVAHPTCAEVYRKDNFSDHLEMFDILTDDELKCVYTLIAKKKAGFEINIPFHLYKTDEERQKAIRPYILAKECGCKFYLGSDAHHPDALDSAYDNFSLITELIGLDEEDKFRIFK
ncbi:MAG: hypothetical protein IKV88_04705 [Clostridia bacterium]|nr:hypothetical protein [Clostridia bacterium]